MSIPISGTLYDPFGNVARFADIKFVTLQGFGDVIESSSAVYRTDENGAYSIDVQLGRYAVYMRFNGNNGAYDKIQTITVNSDVVASTLGELLEYTEPLTPAEILIVQQLAAEAVAAKDDAQAAALQAAIDESLAAASASSAQASATAASNSVALLAPVAVNGGEWASGQQFTAYNQYMIYSGEAYSPLPATSLPYTVGATPNLSFVYQIVLNDHSKLANRNAVGAHDAIYRRETTVAEISAGDFEVGDKLVITDRNNAKAVVVSGTANGYDKVNAQGGKVAQIEISEPNTVYASQLGFVADTVYTTYFNGDLAAFVEENDISRIILDTGDIIVNDTLADTYGAVTFGGDGKLLTNNIDNTLQRIRSQKTDSKKYHGQYNIGAMFNSVAKNAIFKRKEIRIVLFGDSISVCADYDSFGSIPAGYRQPIGVDNYDRNNCFGATLFNEICNAVPSDVRVRFYSRSIGGLAYGNVDQPWDSIGGQFSGREQATAGKAWRDCVLDLNPDLVIHGFGMNESASTYIDNFLTKWHQYLDAEQKTLSFDQAIVTTPNPNFIDAAPFGDFKNYGFNASKFFVATMQRYVAKKYRYSLIDVAFNSYLKRYGVDTRSVNFKAKSDPYLFPNGASSRVIAAGEAPSLSNITPKDLPLYWSTKFVLNSATASNSAGYDFKFTAGSIIVQFAGGSINLYSGNYSGAGLFVKSTSYTLPASTNTTFTLTVTPSSIYLYVNDELKIAATDTPFNATLPMQFDNSGGNSAVTVSSGLTYGVEFARYGQDSITNGDYYGVLDFTQNANGGGVNHPSSTMLAEIYLPPVREYITEMLKSSIEYDTVVGGTAAGQMVFLGRALGKQYNRISIKDRGSSRETIVDFNGPTTWTVAKNTGGAVSIYIDAEDLSVFLFNPSDPVLQIEFTGDWLVKRPTKLGVTTPRGTLLPTVA